MTQATTVSQSNTTSSPIVTSRTVDSEAALIQVRKDIYSTLNTAMNVTDNTNRFNNTGFEEMVKSIATNVIDTSMSGIPTMMNQPQVRTI